MSERTGHILAVILAACCVFISSRPAAQQDRRGYQKPEIRDAIEATREMLVPMRFARQEVWYNSVVDDPSRERYKIGRAVMRFDRDAENNFVLGIDETIVKKMYSVTMQESNASITIVVSPNTGRTIRMSMTSTTDSRAYWKGGVKLPPESRVEVDKTAEFDWTSGQIIITYGSGPDAHRRVVPLERNSIFPAAPFVFMFKLKGLDESRVYHFRYFCIQSEKYGDYYLKYDGKRGKNTHKYSSVMPGWGDGIEDYFWLGPPSENAPNGLFEKIIINPLTTRYITYLPVSEAEAMESVTSIEECEICKEKSFDTLLVTMWGMINRNISK